MKSQQFRNTKTGETVTQVPLSQIADFEEYNGRRCFYSASRNVILDLIDEDAEVGYYSLKNLAETVAECPDAVAMAIDDAHESHQQPFIEPVTEITEAKYWYWLEVLFPEDWHHNGGESFKVCERTCGDITRICCALNDHNPDTKAPRQRRYFTLCDSYKTPHKTIVERCREHMRANP